MSILNHFFDYKPEVLALDEKAMELCQPYFRHMEEIRDFNQLKMLKAFADTQMSSTDMLGTTGYGLWDTGRAKLEQIFAEVMGAEDALVRSQFQSGTHTLAVALFGLLRAGDTLLAATGRPYDTLEGVIGLDGKGKGTGTLMDYGIQYDEAPLKADFTPDYDLIAQKAPGAKVCHIQRSRGYLQRNAFDLETIRKIADTARAANPDIIIFVDNCYGEFTQTQEPCQMGADLVVGSLIKNPGGGIAPTGGYIAGRKDLVELCAYRLNAPGLGKDLGCTLETPRDMYLGFYYAPGVVCEAIKTAIYAQCMLELLGKNPRQIHDIGVSMAFVPEDRLGMGLVGSMGMADNMMLKTYREHKGPFVDRKAPRALAQRLIDELEIVTPGVGTPVRRLSGGNVQKVLVGREIAQAPSVLMTAYAVRGLDINTSYTIYNLLTEQKMKGIAVVYVGEDLDVLLELCDRIVVLCGGQVSGVVDARTADKRQVGALMTRVEGGHENA